ncbi:MAG: cupin domain-containing protein [Nitrosomonas sp.]|nr:cupin domain-containing protein [Nitrosomonas sp.]MDH5513887.1 cupin domain-containing protein [Gammaproteobacteria bacterium]
MEKRSLITIILLATSINASASDQALVISAEDESLQWGACPAFIPEGCEIAVLQGDPAKDNVDIFFKVPGDFSIPYHTHTSQERMVLVSGELVVTYDNHETATIKTGDFAYGPEKLPHKAYCKKGDDCILYIGFVAPLDAIPVEEK